MNTEKTQFYISLYIPIFLVLLAWLVKFYEFSFNADLSFLGIYPLSVKGLPGLVLSPFLHGDFNHLIANTIPLFVLGWALFYYYRSSALNILIIGWLVTGLWVWLFARESYHIGASGIIYFLASFHFLSGIIRRNSRLVAFSMLVIFLYGGMFWGVFPDFFPHRNVSWESHLMGAVAGVVLAISYRDKGPSDDVYVWDDDDDDNESESAYQAESESEREDVNTSLP
jgi:membrane associated rhomboid family serine protease